VADANAAVVFRLPVAPVSPPPPELVGLELKQLAVGSHWRPSRADGKLAAGKEKAAALVLLAAESYLK
jgi:hypothetical protein